MFEDEFGTVPHLMEITGCTTFKALITDIASEVSHSLVVVVSILAGRPIVDGLVECESDWRSGTGRG